MTRLLLSATLLAFALLPRPAAALYLSAGGGALLVQDSALDVQDVKVAELGFERGAAFFGAVGVEPLRGFRLEVEGARRANDNERLVDKSDPALPLSEAASGDIRAASLMVTAALDFPLGGRWYPYIAGGIGAAEVALELRDSAGVLLLDDRRVAFAYQGQVGMGYDLGDGLSVFLGYRYFATDTLEMTSVGGLEFDLEYDSHSLEGGLRFSF